MSGRIERREADHLDRSSFRSLDVVPVGTGVLHDEVPKPLAVLVGRDPRPIAADVPGSTQLDLL
jgi:hypothetical protein